MKACVFILWAFLFITLPVSASETDTLHVAVETDIRSTNPGVKRDRTTDVVLHHVVESLVAYRENLTVAPMLAETITQSDDGRSYSFTLRQGVRFHNGELMTADHVKWSWERMLNPDTGWRCRRWYDGTGTNSVKIVSITVHSPTEVEFVLENPSASFLHRMANLQCITAILHPLSVDENDAWITPIGTGPYTVSDWQRGEYVLLEQFADYVPASQAANGLSGIKKAKQSFIKFIIIPDASVAKAALSAGDVDIVMQVPMTVYPEMQEKSGVKVWVQPVLDWNTLLIQTQDPLLSDVRIRRAIAHSIDRTALAKYATYGVAGANSSAVPTLNAYYSAQHANWYEHDLNKAKSLMSEAGYSGEVLAIQTNKKAAHLYDSAIILHAMLRRAGFNVELEVIDWATQLQNYLTGDFQLSAFDYSARTEPFMNYQVITGAKAQNPAMQWDSTVAITLLDQSETLFSASERQRHFEEMHALMREDVPIIGLYNKAIMYAQTDRIEGYEGWILGLQRFWGVEKRAGDNNQEKGD